MYFFDSYALVEIVEGNPNYATFLGHTINVSVFNIAEFIYYLLRNHDEPVAREKLAKLNANILDISESDLVEAAKFRHANKLKKYSYSDCIGYILAKRNGILFLTGDKEFEGMGNVEFVK